MLLIKRGGHAWNILMLLLITGEFPFRSLSLLGNERMLKATAVRMSDVHDIRFYDSDKTYRCRLITISGKSTWKTMRLCRSGFDLIADEMPELLSSYLDDTYGHRFHGEKRVTERNHRIAEASVMCMKAGIECRRHLVTKGYFKIYINTCFILLGFKSLKFDSNQAFLNQQSALELT